MQYRTDRDPTELIFAKRVVVNFAVDPDLVFVTTQLHGQNTAFLPFNTGSDGPGQPGGAGNPRPTTPGSYATSYLWEHVWRPDKWLELLERFVHFRKEKEPTGRTRRPARCRAQLPDHGIGRLRQVQHHRLAGPPAHLLHTEEQAAGSEPVWKTLHAELYRLLDPAVGRFAELADGPPRAGPGDRRDVPGRPDRLRAKVQLPLADRPLPRSRPRAAPPLRPAPAQPVAAPQRRRSRHRRGRPEPPAGGEDRRTQPQPDQPGIGADERLR